jgi:cell division protein FtsI/penicillin-binding protein 2/cell division protein FtsW (lipid II flippase)
VAVTRSWTASGVTAAEIADCGIRPAARSQVRWVVAASLLVAMALVMVYAAKTRNFSADTEHLQNSEVVNVNAITSADQLTPVLQGFRNQNELAENLAAFVRQKRPLKNVGAIARVLPSRQSFGRLKPLLVVRTPNEFRRVFLLWTALYFAGFYQVAFVWRKTRFHGDTSYLPALLLLTGIGLTLMVSLHDPLRDTLEFQKFALGVFLGCVLLTLPAFKIFHYAKLSEWCYTPLLGALCLFGLLLAFGRGPGASDAKVNLGPFQPVELIKILLVVFLAGYFTRNWERLRDLRERRIWPGLWRRLGVPRLEHLVPVLIALGMAVALFFLLKDLGPALVTFFVFLAMFGVARGRPGLALAGLTLMVASVAIGYHFGKPTTVVDRINMWVAPWDNDVHGGDQLAHGLWAFSTGGPFGSGPGWGDPDLIPAGNTDLVLPAIGEEWGFVGVASVLLLIGFLVARAMSAAARAATRFGFFLALGLGALIGFEMMLISSGVLGLLPLSGVVSPFLSSGNTAMLANFLVVAVLISISTDVREAPPEPLLNQPARWVKGVLAATAVVLLAAAARYQLFQDREYLARDAHAIEQDGVKRPQHNPRINSLARLIPRGSILDRNGIPLATSDWAELERNRERYKQLGLSIEESSSRLQARHYPLGAATAHIVGDFRTQENFYASNSSLVEHDLNTVLQGYDYAELADLVRHRHQPGNPDIKRLLARDKNVRLTIDARLQVKAYEILQHHLRRSTDGKGALVVMDAGTGDVLAMLSGPAPDPKNGSGTPDELLDRARYGLYPPGSTFKLVTAIAALKKDPALEHRTYVCLRLPGGRAGNAVAGWRRVIKDDVGDHAHGKLDLERAITVSCNAYFAQLGVYDVGAPALAETAARFGISTGGAKELQRALPFAAYGQGPVLASPFKMARVAATIAAGGRMPAGRWIAAPADTPAGPPVDLLSPAQAAFLQRAMRRVVTEGTARRPMAGSPVSMAGKTGTAQLDRGLPHAWFAGFAPYEGDAAHRLAFAVLVEHGGYGAGAAAPIAREVMEAAKELGLLR